MARRTSLLTRTADSARQWHRLFGLLLTDHLAGSSFTVELEKDLSKKQQLLDVVVVRRGPGELPRPLPDGLNDLLPTTSSLLNRTKNRLMIGPSRN